MAVGVNYCCTVLLILGMATICLTQKTHLKYHLQHLTGERHPASPDTQQLLEARSYIKDQFRQYDLELVINHFNTTVVIKGQEKTITGENIVGVARGDADDSVLVVGADYDTTPQQSPLENNGGGVATMLEVARMYMNSTGPGRELKRRGTVLFVAFDLNTIEYAAAQPDERYGRPGAYYFLHQWLWPFLNQSSQKFVGAIILDSITKFNTKKMSQYLPSGFEKTFPAAHERIASMGNRGDFLAMYTRTSRTSHHLTSVITASYNEGSTKASPPRLQELPVVSGAPANSDTLSMFNHQAHFHFWTFQPSAEPLPLTAVLLTDTDIYRGSGEVCGPPCSAKEFLTPSRQLVLSHIASTLTNTLLQLQTEQGISDGSTGVALVPTLALTSSLVALMRLLH
ncbi:uncharacterized protein LOC121874481 [Homarus americanus]|uniref:Putative Peptidase family M28-like 1 n=1 Tax=Homarus americanus TaxID=6706 RepID=A0A8J5JYW4_HOMAM|nr:uncharacterized protein LOC121874481 [Homarus americanus]KAG7161919.1 putative Peptidase family M28-like 1 [Homarus americanus]